MLSPVDQVPPLRCDGQFHDFPTESVLLRFTNALDEKRRRYFNALSKGIIAEDDQYVLAINSRGIRHDAPYEKTMPFFVQAFLPIGPLVVPINVTTKQWEEAFYQHRPAISKVSGSSVSTRTFLGEDAKFGSVILLSSHGFTSVERGPNIKTVVKINCQRDSVRCGLPLRFSALYQ